MQVREATKRVLAQGDRFLSTGGGVTILIYHRVAGGSGSEVDLDLDAFRAQLDHLAEHHRVISLDDAVERLAGSEPDDGQHAVVVTFDDGTADFTDVVVPEIARVEIPVTLYVSTHYVDSGVEFPWDAPPTTWSALREACSTGLVTIGSHTHTHALLDRSDGTIEHELDRSIELIGEHLGRRPAHFAYPKALPGSDPAEDAVRARFTSAALARSRVNRPGDTDLHRLWRTPIQRSDGHRWFTAKADGGLRLEGEVRDAIARFKYRRAVR